MAGWGGKHPRNRASALVESSQEVVWWLLVSWHKSMSRQGEEPGGLEGPQEAGRTVWEEQE